MFRTSLFTACVLLGCGSAIAQRDVRAELAHSDQVAAEMERAMIRREVTMLWTGGDGPIAFRITTAADKPATFRVDPATGKVSPFAGDLPPTELTPLSPLETTARHHRNGSATTLLVENTREDGIVAYWLDSGNQRVALGSIPARKSATFGTFAGHRWLFTDAGGATLAGVVAGSAPGMVRVGTPVADPAARGPGVSPDGRWTAAVRDHNLTITPAAGGAPLVLTTNGTAEDTYQGPFHWSPDAKYLVAWQVRKVPTRKIHLVQSTPPDRLEPRLQTIDYPKPGDPIRQPKPRLFDLTTRRAIPLDDALFPNPWEISRLAWSDDSSGFSFLYNQRGHQLMRVIGIRAADGSARTLIEERSTTFIDHSQKTWLHRPARSTDILWASERSGHNHLYRVSTADGATHPITSGDWNVREVVRTDDTRRRLLLKINGVPGSDPYYEHFAWVNYDGSGFTRLTTGDGTHALEFSPDDRWFTDTWSRVDHPPVTELRRASDGALVAELARDDDSALLRRGWQRPERFAAPGRDGRTAIHGIILRPPGFDPAKKYPVLEHIYAGPQDYFTPKSHFVRSTLTDLAALGFVVVQCDGMGTNWRDKAFHDVCWKNLADAGLPDRIAWLKAAAATRPWLDLRRVGIFGGSAGGQNALAALLHHGDFYQAAVADCGCHDNRMDKLWWNEAWMGWPVDDSYARNSNATHAANLRGHLMLIVGELDHNVDPASTMQVVGALQRAGKSFDFVPVINAGHGAAETPYGRFRRAEFFVTHLGGPQ